MKTKLQISSQSISGFCFVWLFACAMIIPMHKVLAADQKDFVSVSGTQLILHNNPFTPKGTNLIDFDSFWDETKVQPTLNWTREQDFKHFQSAGFNSIRLVVKSDYFQDPKPPYAFNEQGFVWLDKVIALAKRHNQKIILDMHIPSGGKYQDYQIYPGNQIFWNDPWLKGRFVDVWREIARRYAGEPTLWAFDLMNEPATTDFKAYEKLMRDTANSIRLYDPNHILMIQRGMYIKDDLSWGMKYPQIQDTEVVKSIHFYQPTDFTMQNAPWITKQTPMVTYPTATTSQSGADVWNAQRIKKEMDDLITEAQASGTPAVLTEYGPLFQPKLSGQLQWIIDVTQAVQESGVGWHYWNYASPSCFKATALWSHTALCRPMTWKTLSGFAQAK